MQCAYPIIIAQVNKTNKSHHPGNMNSKSYRKNTYM